MASVDSPCNTVQNQQRTLFFFFSLFMTIANVQEGKKKKITIPSNNIIHDNTIIP